MAGTTHGGGGCELPEQEERSFGLQCPCAERGFLLPHEHRRRGQPGAGGCPDDLQALSPPWWFLEIMVTKLPTFIEGLPQGEDRLVLPHLRGKNRS